MKNVYTTPNMIYKPGAYIFDFIKNRNFDSYKELLAKQMSFGQEQTSVILFLSAIMMDGLQSRLALEMAFNVFHELHHYLQDLTIHACIVKSEFQDKLHKYLCIASNIKGLKYPLFERGNEISNKSIIESTALTKDLNYIHDIYVSLFQCHYDAPDNLKFVSACEDSSSPYHLSLCYQDLVEAHAYWKTLLNVLHSVDNSEQSKLVRDYLNDTNYFPFICKEHFVGCNDDAFRSKKKYLAVFLVFMTVMGVNKSFVDYFHDGDFTMFKNSQIEFFLFTFICLLEISLSIPNPDFVISSIRSGKSIDDFSVVHRFYRFIEKIRKNGLPPSVENEYWFDTLAKWFADDEILSYEKTNNSVGVYLEERSQINGEIVAVSQVRAMLHRKRYPYYFFHYTPILLLGNLEIPLYIYYDGKIEAIICSNKGFTNFVKEDGTHLSCYDEFFLKEDILKYKDQSKGFDLAILQHNARGMFREIINRQMAHSIMESLLNGEYFCCPFKKGLCPYYQDGKHGFYCNEIHDMSYVSQFCKSNIIRRLDYKKIVDDESGKFPDCMFINYMHDYHFNYMNIHFDSL